MNAARTYFFCPAGPARSVVSSNPATCAAVISVLISFTTSAIRPRPRQAGMDEPGRDPRAGHVGDQLRAPLHRHVLENDQVNGQGAQVRADATPPSPALPPGGRHMLPAAAAPSLVQVMLDPARRHQRHLQLLERPGHAQVPARCQARAAPARPGWAVPVHSHRARAQLIAVPGAPGCFPCLRPPPVRAAAASRRHASPAGHPTKAASTSSRCYGPAHAPSARPARPAPPAAARSCRDHLVPGSARRAARRRRRQTRTRATMIQSRPAVSKEPRRDSSTRHPSRKVSNSRA